MSQVTDNKLMKKHKCPVCGKKFETNRKDAKTCSPKCRQAMYRANPNPARPKPVAKKESGIKLGIVKTEHGLEFRYPQRIIKSSNNEGSKAFIDAIIKIKANTGITDDYIYNDKISGTYEEFVKLSKLDVQSQRKIIDLILNKGKLNIKDASDRLLREERERRLEELDKSSRRR